VHLIAEPITGVEFAQFASSGQNNPLCTFALSLALGQDENNANKEK
jgi:hypothetical protein